ncbi:MAG: hypothetical protein GY868_08060 [Deltaproteobacteria bacterium]|nr:hypothetical protein [Deltaproteobacteria bacterium]
MSSPPHPPAGFQRVINLHNTVSEASAALYIPEEHSIWTLGDSGCGTLLGRTRLHDNETDIIKISGADNIDWEAMVTDEDGNIWILDVGDNNATRSNISAYRITPQFLDDEHVLHTDKNITITYADGPRDVEAAACLNERIFLFEKIPLFSPPHAARVASIDISPGAATRQITHSEGTLAIFQPITDASLSPEGHLYLLTYTGIHISKSWSPTQRSARPLGAFFLGQQESLAALGDNRFIIGIESGPVYYKTFPAHRPHIAFP